jgi:hypothetical protein
MMVMVMGPVALLAGMAGGRRWWWLPGTPWALLGIIGLVIVPGSQLEHTLIPAFFAAATLAAGWGFLGAWISERPASARAIAAVCTAYLAVFGVVAMSLQVRDAVGVLWGIALVELSFGGIASGYLWQRGKPWRRLAALATLGWGACVLALITALLVGMSYGMVGPEVVVTLRAIVVVASVLAVLLAVAAFRLWRRTRGSLPTGSAVASEKWYWLLTLGALVLIGGLLLAWHGLQRPPSMGVPPPGGIRVFQIPTAEGERGRPLPSDISVDPEGRVYVSDVQACQVFVFAPDTRLLQLLTIGSSPMKPSPQELHPRTLTHVGQALLVLALSPAQHSDVLLRYDDLSKEGTVIAKLQSSGAMASCGGDALYVFSGPRYWQAFGTPGAKATRSRPIFRLSATTARELGEMAGPPTGSLDCRPNGDLFVLYGYGDQAGTVIRYSASGKEKARFTVPEPQAQGGERWDYDDIAVGSNLVAVSQQGAVVDSRIALFDLNGAWKGEVRPTDLTAVLPPGELGPEKPIFSIICFDDASALYALDRAGRVYAIPPRVLATLMRR